MGRLSQLIASVLVPFAPFAHAAVPEDAVFEARAGDFLRKAGASFVSHKRGTPVLEQSLRIPPVSQDPKQAGRYAALKALVIAASRVQEGCQAPCTGPADIALYRGKIEMIARKKLGLNPAGVKAAIENYLPKGVPRIRTATASSDRASDLLEAEVMRKMMATSETAAAVRAGLSRRALALAEALGRAREITADARGFAVLPDGQHRGLTAADIAAFNRIPAAQASYLKRPASSPPPLTAQEKSDTAMKEVDELIEKNPGRVREALGYWKSESQNQGGNPLWRGYAYFNRGLLSISGLDDVEASAARLGYAAASGDVTTHRTVWEGFKTTANAGMFAANFVGLSGGAAVIRSAWAIGNPIVIEGVGQLSKTAAQQVTARSAAVTETVAAALASGGKSPNYKAATEAMNEYARGHLGGVIQVGRGGHIGQADFIAKEMKIAYSPLIGESHEFAHAGQMFVNRANALELTAQRAGKTAAQLSPAEVEQAMALASRFEKGYYMHHEAQALRSSGLFGLSPGPNYGAKLAANGAELTWAMLGAPSWSFTPGQKVFGALSGLGDSQVKVAASLLPAFNVPPVKDAIANGLR